MTPVKFQEMNEPAPTYEAMVAEYGAIDSQLDAAANSEGCSEAIQKWDQLRRRLDTWHALTDLRFNQETDNEEFKKARDYCDELTPKLTDLEVKLQKKLLASEHRAALEKQWGRQAFDLWECGVKSFDPAIQEDLVQESKLESQYIELLASAKLPFQGETYNLSGIGKFHEDADRQTRHDSQAAKWNWFGENREQLDSVFDELVKLRTKMAQKLGLENFIELGYRRMSRIDYNQADVERYRQAVRDEVVPLTVELREQQRERLGLDKLMAWDAPINDLQGNPTPQGDHDWMVERAQEMFDEMGSGLDSFFRMMTDSDLLDLKVREGKAGGGFCTSFATYGVPYIFANFNGTKGDVEVFTHEAGHAFQGYLSRNQPLTDYLWPTYESCEIHSMSLEFLTWPHMEKFFGDDAERFRKIHLAGALHFLPYGVAVDHFQHLIYAQPNATPQERNEMWLEMQRTYLPWIDFGDLEHPAQGGRWQLQRHIYLSPFYYIDYTLAQTCALQFWVRARNNFEEAMQAYVALCQRGGEAPFGELVQGCGLTSPFEPGCLSQVVAEAKAVLGI